MNRIGFTLIELLAVIVILAIIALIAVPIVLNIINDSKNQAIERSAELYEKAVLNAILKNQLDGKKIVQNGTYMVDKNSNICLTKKYDTQTQACSDELIVVEVDGEKPTAGTLTLENNALSKIMLTINEKAIIKRTDGSYKNIENLCILMEDDDDKAGNIGSKYKCNVEPSDKENYYFYILETDTAKTTLIMDRNYSDNQVPITMSWCKSGEDNSCNHDNLDQYVLYLQNKWPNVIVGIPHPSQIARASGNNNSDYYTQEIPEWLYDYLAGTAHPEPNVYGYWTNTTNFNNQKYPTSLVWDVSYYGYLTGYTVNVTGYAGLRPIITIPTSALN